MTIDELQKLLDHHGLKIDGYHAGDGKFRDLEIGVGMPTEKLTAFAADVKSRWSGTAKVTHVTNTDHADYGKSYAEIPSYWWDETKEKEEDKADTTDNRP